MTKLPKGRVILAAAVVLVLAVGAVVAIKVTDQLSRNMVVAYFDNSNQVFRGDDVMIRGVPVGKIAEIEPQPDRVKITFWFDRKYKVPADVKAVIISPQLVTGRAVQLIPPYGGGPTLGDGAVIPQSRTAVPIEWDQVREQLQRLAELLKPASPGGVSTLGQFVSTAADNLRGQGATIRDAVIKLSQAVATLGDHSGDLFSTIKNLSIVVSALKGSAGLLESLNTNLAEVSALLVDDPNKVGQAARDLNSVVGDVKTFVADNRESIGVASDKLSSISNAVVASLDDLKQTLHIAPTTVANFNAIYEPANGSLTGAMAASNFADPIGFLCGSIQAASRLNAEQAAKLCVQYLAPIVKNRQYNYLPLGQNLLVGAQARPNEVTYSEDWMRPDYVPPAVSPAAPVAVQSATVPGSAEPVTSDPAAGLQGLMVPQPGGGS
ncbi:MULTISPECIES: MCE family protein [unclassified Mycobacterium]|uniref:MCE family protein n=1 Tax=unclassified Mycobacterium TaxID=2642494 RepID=UPI0006903EB9|nr:MULTISPECIES: MCE family protein [unclassified Mycobacterium]SEA61294.1 phospholipid/cholesterol/gamma-HCH transport system substrate-binding protein [Mycobacterium sp. 283mftsu]